MSASLTAMQMERQSMARRYLLNQANKTSGTITFPDVIGEADSEVVAADARLRRKLAGQSGTTVTASGKGTARITMPTVVGV